MSETKEVIVVHCDCHDQSNHQSRSVSHNPNSRSVQSRSDDSSASTALGVVGGVAIGFGLALVIAALLSND